MSESKPKIDPYPLSSYNTWAWERNRDPILHAFKTFFPTTGKALELASGSGSHVSYFASHFPGLWFQPSDRDVRVFEAIKANRARAGIETVADPVRIDLMEPDTWPEGKDQLFDVIFAINVFHLAPVAAIDGFAQIAARVLQPQGVAAVYGPFNVDGKYTSASNEAFDSQLRASGNSGSGLKDVCDLAAAAGKHGLQLKKRLDMPANNFLIVFGRS